MKLTSIVSVLLLSMSSALADPPAADYAEYASKNGVKTKVYSQFVDFFSDLISGKVRIVEVGGFSGAGYADMDAYKRSFMAFAETEIENTRALLGNAANTVFVLGGSVDGFGAAYEFLDEARGANPKFSNIIVAGMVSDQVVQYHLEGAAKGWGDVISPKQDMLLLAGTNWDLKVSEGSQSYTTRLLTAAAQLGIHTKWAIFEGGPQAFAETLELTYEVNRSQNRLVQIELIPGFEPKKANKDNGIRAARNAVLFYISNPYTNSNNVNAVDPQEFVQVRSSRGLESLKSYSSHEDVRKLKGQIKLAKTEITSLERARDKAQPDSKEFFETQAKIKYLNSIQPRAIQEVAVREAQCVLERELAKMDGKAAELAAAEPDAFEGSLEASSKKVSNVTLGMSVDLRKAVTERLRERLIEKTKAGAKL